VLDTLFHALIRYAAPVLVFTGEEVWKSRFPDESSVHLLEWPVVPEIGAELMEKWVGIRTVRQSVNASIEPLRRGKEIGSSLEASVKLKLDIDDIFGFNGQNLFVCSADNTPISIEMADLLEVCIVAEIAVESGEGEISVVPTTHHKCGRCWRHLPEVAEDGDLCSRCDQVVSGMDAG